MVGLDDVDRAAAQLPSERETSHNFSARADADDTSSLDGIAVDNQSRIYVNQTRQINVLDSDGHFLRAIPSAVYENVNSEFEIDRENNLLVLNRTDSKIYKMSVTP